MRSLFHFALADFRERSRQYGFFITVILTLYLGYVIYNGDMYLAVGPYRGYYNSAWVGSLMTLTITIFVGLFGFYLIKNSIKRDIQTGVGQIIATTPTNRLTYLLGKWLSHLMILGVITLILMAAALVMQITYREVPEIDVWALLSPFMIIALPTLSMIGGFAVFFEAVPFLRGGGGNIIYFFFFMSLFPFVIEGFEKWGISNDPWGLRLFMPSMQASVCETYGYCKNNFEFTFPDGTVLEKALYPGIQWSWELIYPRFLWIGIGLLFVLLGAVIFNRFDSTKLIKEKKGKQKQEQKTGPLFGINRKQTAVIQPLSRLEKRSTPFPFFRIWIGELLLLVKTYPLWIYAASLGLIIASLFSPLEVTRSYLLPASWALPILVWSKMGCRETEFNTQQLVFTAPNLFRKQWLAAYLAGVTITALTGSGAFLRFLIDQPTGAVPAWIVAVFFIPALALAAGTIGGTSRGFEVIYALIWYMGPLQQLPALDFVGAVGAPTYTLHYALITVGLIAAALIGRRVRLLNL